MRTKSTFLRDLPVAANSIKKTVKETVYHYSHDSLYRNSFYIMLSTAILSFFGFFFWIINARLYTPEQVGIATTLISVMTLLSNFSLLGFNIGLIRYLPKATNRNEKINSALVLVIFATILSSLIFISGLHWFSPQLAFLQTNVLFISSFVIFIIGACLNTIIESIFMAYRSSSNILIKNTLLSIQKIIFPFFFIFLGAYGMFTSVAIATLTSVMFAFIQLLIKYKYVPSLTVKVNTLKEMAAFSGGNYVSSFLSQAPSLILPIFIVNMLSPKVAAYYYVSAMILGFLVIIPFASTQSFLAEGSHDEDNVRSHFIKATKITYLILIPAIFAITLFGNIPLHFFGNGYAQESFTFLRIISISALFMSISSLGNAVFRIRHQIKLLIAMNFIGATGILALSYVSIPYGLISLGWGWLIGQFILALVYILVIGKKTVAYEMKQLLLASIVNLQRS